MLLFIFSNSEVTGFCWWKMALQFKWRDYYLFLTISWVKWLPNRQRVSSFKYRSWLGFIIASVISHYESTQQGRRKCVRALRIITSAATAPYEGHYIKITCGILNRQNPVTFQYDFPKYVFQIFFFNLFFKTDIKWLLNMPGTDLMHKVQQETKYKNSTFLELILGREMDHKWIQCRGDKYTE